MFVCRGTERYQVPLLAPPSHQFSLRYTVSLYQETSKIHDLGLENWHACTRAQRIRKSIPSHLTITMFGSVPDSESVPIEIREPGLGETRTTDEPELAVHERSSSQACEDWAPPPVPLHGPKFRLLQPHEKQDLVKLHKNLGHPDPNVLSQHLKASGASEHVVEIAKEYICDACVETTRFRHQRPAKLHEPKEFNDLLGIDGFFWTGKKDFQVMIFHCIDEASLFHLGRRLDNRHLEHAIPAFNDMWMSWAGQPSGIYSDPAGEFRADDWLTFLQR